MKTIVFVLGMLFLGHAFPMTSGAAQADWPQWRGPERTGLSTETGLLKQWPAEGPKLAWRSEGGKGTVALVEADPAAYKETGRFDQPGRSKENSWAHPVVAGGKLYLRDQSALLCYELRGE